VSLDLDLSLDTLISWKRKPFAMVHDLFSVRPDPWQFEALEAFPHTPRMAMKACAGPGKTALLAWLGWNFLLTRPHPMIGATSVNAANLRANLWTELARWYAAPRAEILRALFTMTKTEIFAKDHAQTWRLEARTWAQDANAEQIGNALAGLHAKNVMWLLDESGAYPDSIMPVCEAIFAGDPTEAHIVQAGNPTHLSGPLYAAFGGSDDLVRARNHHEALDLPVLVGAQEGVVVLDRHAAVGIAVGTQHVGMREEARAAVDAPLADRRQPQRLHAVERVLAQRQLVEVRRGRPAGLLVDVAGVVEPVAEAGMGLESRAVRHVDRAGQDVIDGGLPIVTLRRLGHAEAEPSASRAAASRRRRSGDGWRRRRRGRLDGGVALRRDGGDLGTRRGLGNRRGRQPESEQLSEEVAIVDRRRRRGRLDDLRRGGWNRLA
jgi:hypothetical protein